MKETLGALGVGVAIAAIVSCGGSSKKASMAPTTMGSDAGAGLPIGKRDPRIVELDTKITDDFAQLGLGERPMSSPPNVMSGCTNPPCATPTAAEIKLRKDDPTCKPGTAQVCTDTCKLSDSICDSAVKICTIAKELGGDAWATEKCASGTSSCEAAQGKCCGCS